MPEDKKTLYALVYKDKDSGTKMTVQFSFNRALLEEISTYLMNLRYMEGVSYTVEEIPPDGDYFDVVHLHWQSPSGYGY